MTRARTGAARPRAHVSPPPHQPSQTIREFFNALQKLGARPAGERVANAAQPNGKRR